MACCPEAVKSSDLNMLGSTLMLGQSVACDNGLVQGLALACAAAGEAAGVLSFACIAAAEAEAVLLSSACVATLSVTFIVVSVSHVEAVSLAGLGSAVWHVAPEALDMLLLTGCIWRGCRLLRTAHLFLAALSVLHRRASS